MTLSNIKNKERGFTIVELLIVIVVIAILAAITIIAYNGIQNRAKTAQYQADANAIVKVAESLNAKPDGNGYPSSTATLPGVGDDEDVKLPANVQIADASTVTDATKDANPAVDTANNTKTYRVYFCEGAPNTRGITVFYWDFSSNTLKSMNAGTGCPTGPTAAPAP